MTKQIVVPRNSWFDVFTYFSAYRYTASDNPSTTIPLGLSTNQIRPSRSHLKLSNISSVQSRGAIFISEVAGTHGFFEGQNLGRHSRHIAEMRTGKDHPAVICSYKLYSM